MDDLQEDAIAALTDPRDQLLVASGYIRALTEVVEIITDQAEMIGSEAERQTLADLIEELRPLVEDNIQERNRLAKLLAPNLSTSEH